MRALARCNCNLRNQARKQASQPASQPPREGEPASERATTTTATSTATTARRRRRRSEDNRTNQSKQTADWALFPTLSFIGNSKQKTGAFLFPIHVKALITYRELTHWELNAQDWERAAGQDWLCELTTSTCERRGNVTAGRLLGRLFLCSHALFLPLPTWERTNRERTNREREGELCVKGLGAVGGCPRAQLDEKMGFLHSSNHLFVRSFVRSPFIHPFVLRGYPW